jgi:hypothetical protein
MVGSHRKEANVHFLSIATFYDGDTEQCFLIVPLSDDAEVCSIHLPGLLPVWFCYCELEGAEQR